MWENRWRFRGPRVCLVDTWLELKMQTHFSKYAEWVSLSWWKPAAGSEQNLDPKNLPRVDRFLIDVQTSKIGRKFQKGSQLTYNRLDWESPVSCSEYVYLCPTCGNWPASRSSSRWIFLHLLCERIFLRYWRRQSKNFKYLTCSWQRIQCQNKPISFYLSRCRWNYWAFVQLWV